MSFTGRTLYVVRHADRQDSKDRNWQKHFPDLKRDNPPLSDYGRQQAHDLKNYFKAVDIQHVYASPFDRTMETATIFTSEKELNLNVEPGLSEVLYLCENPPGYWAMDKLNEKFPRINLDYSPVFDTPLPPDSGGGWDCTPRLRQTIEGILERHPEPMNIVVVSHQSSIDSIYTALDCGSNFVGLASISKFVEIAPMQFQLEEYVRHEEKKTVKKGKS